MKWRHWAILIILVLLNYIIFSTAFTQLAAQQQPKAHPIRTALPTFQAMDVASANWVQPSKWIVLPTCTAIPTRTPVSPTPTLELIPTDIPTTTELLADFTPIPEPTLAPTLHTVQQGESLSVIAQKYGVTVEALAQANSLSESSVLLIDQTLIIPGTGQAEPTTTPIPPTYTPAPKPTKPPTPRPTQPPTATPTPKPQFQFTAQVVWDPLVAPNCIGPGIAKQSTIVDLAGNPVNGVVVEVDCYGNVWRSHPSGTPGEYDAGHYDFAFGQSSPQNWTCSARVVEVNGQPAQSSVSIDITFDTNNCKPGGSGHQAAILNWTKHW